MEKATTIISRQRSKADCYGKKTIAAETGINKRSHRTLSVLSVLLGLMVATTIAFAQPNTGKWGQQLFSQAKALPLGQGASVEELCPAMPDYMFTVPDPTGDTFGFGSSQHDIISISAKGDASTVCLTVEFAGPVDPADAGTGQEVTGFIEFDTDENIATGFLGNAESFCSGRAGIGIEAYLDLFSVSGGFATLYPTGDSVPVVFNGNSFTAVIPLAALGGDSAFSFANVLGTYTEPTDCAPNEGSIHSPDGSIVLVPTIASISGRVVDSRTGEPLRGDAPPFASAELHQCFDSGCIDFNVVNVQPTNSEGRFLFDSDFTGGAPTVGTYQVAAFADQFQQGRTPPFDVKEGETKDAGNIPLEPSFLQVLDIVPCRNLSPLGGTCKYRLKLSNTSSTRLKGGAWSLVDGSGIGSVTGFTQFQTGRSGDQSPEPQRVNIGPGESKTLNFRFQVPGAVANGAFICTSALVGQGSTPVFNTLADRFLFCISKGSSGFTPVPENTARQMMLQRSGAKAWARKR